MALLVLAIAGAVLAFSPRGVIPPDLGTGIGDKAAHAVFAAIAGAMLAFAFPLQSAALVLVGIVVVAALVEIAQPLVGRGADVEDAWMTVLGACSGYCFVRLVFDAGARALRAP